VVFGKADGSAINLSAVASGIGGFAINGEAASDFSGISASSAGDVNGDGFADVIVGADGADPNGNSLAGKSYVVFGGNFTGSVTQQGTTGNDTLAGSNLADNIVGGLGDDTLLGNGGFDVLYSAAGDDVLAMSDSNFNRLDGGSGNDILRLDGTSLALDLTKIANNRISGIEQIDITGSGNNVLALKRLDVLALSDETSQLIVRGNTGDTLVSGTQGWIASGAAFLDENLFIEYTAGGASLLVDNRITVMIS
jgi:Ca2+-binding RTX toxin-like protein